MNKIVVVFFILFSVIVVSCKNSTESRIKNEFMKFVKSNFDNPSLVKEIVSIEPSDTISNKKIINIIKECIGQGVNTDKLADSIDSIIMEDKFFKKIVRNKYKYVTYIDDLREGIKECLYYQENFGMNLNYYQNILTNIINDSTLLPKTNIIIYKIKYRMKKSENTELNEIYATVDLNKPKDNIIIRFDAVKKSDLDTRFSATMDATEIYIELVTKKTSSYMKILNAYNKLKYLP